MKEIVFSVTAADCTWSCTRGTGSGGQKKNKTNSAVHCIHKPSGAHGYAEDSREQHRNRSTAFARMAASNEFQQWNKMEFLRRTGQQAVIDENVKREMRRIRVDVKNEEGRWTPVDKDSPLSDNE
jgi:protein subunit release factor B